MKSFAATLAAILLLANSGTTMADTRVPSTRPANEPSLVDRFVGYVTGHWTNENQNTLDPENFPLVEANHCGLTVVNPNTGTSQKGFLYQIGTFPQQRRMVFMLTELSDGKLDLASRRFTDPSVISSDFCQKMAKDRLLEERFILPSKCNVVYEYDTQEKVYRGSTAPEGCPSTFQGATALHVKETVSENHFAIEEKWVDANGNQVAGSQVGPYIYVKKKPLSSSAEGEYSCWASLKKPDGTHTFDRGTISDRGGVLTTASIVAADGKTTAYEVHLTRVSFEDRIPVLKLSVRKAGDSKSVFYNWAEVGARNVGVNASWIQVGCTRIK